MNGVLRNRLGEVARRNFSTGRPLSIFWMRHVRKLPEIRKAGETAALQPKERTFTDKWLKMKETQKDFGSPQNAHINVSIYFSICIYYLQTLWFIRNRLYKKHLA